MLLDKWGSTSTPPPPMLPTYGTYPSSDSPLHKLAHHLGMAQHAPRRKRSLASMLLLLVLLLFLVDNYFDLRVANTLGYPRIRTGDAFKDDSAGTQELPASKDKPPQPLTDLGWEADLVYENVGSTDPTAYRLDLEKFLYRAFPSSDTNKTEPDSLLNVLHDYFPPPSIPYVPHPQRALQHLYLMPFLRLWQSLKELYRGPPPPKVVPHHAIPEQIFQTSWQPGAEPPKDKIWPATWRSKNPNTPYQYFDNAAALAFIQQRFNRSLNSNLGRGSIADTYQVMARVPVMQSDFWRYAILASEGGIYSDLDTVCLKPISDWHRNPWIAAQTDPAILPSLIVGVEQDVGTRSDWHRWWPRPLGLVQWTIAGSRGHPILIDVLRRVSEAVNPVNVTLAQTMTQMGEDMHRNLDAVVEQTGPGPWTDSVLRYLGAKYNVTWPDLRNVPDQGIMYGNGDVLVLSVTAFSPGVGNFGAGDVNHASALVQHRFSGSWKAQHG